MPFATLDRSRLLTKPLAERAHDLHLDHWLPLDGASPPFEDPHLAAVAQQVVDARRRGAAVILMMGGHVVRAGVSRHIIDLVERGFVSHVAMNGGASIHDFELAFAGGTTESVARYIRTGEFGLWQETARMNDVIAEAAREGIGMGEALGRAIHEASFPNRELSILAAGYRLHVPVTVHVGIGYDIIHEHANCSGAALGATSYLDFLIIARSICALEGGVVLSFGSAVMAPEIFLKGLSMARNLARQEGEEIAGFTTAVFDLVRLDGNLTKEANRDTAEYYFRPYKTLLVRTVSDGGRSYYFRGEHRATIPALYRQILGCAEVSD